MRNIRIIGLKTDALDRIKMQRQRYHSHAAIKVFFKRCIERQYIDANPNLVDRLVIATAGIGRIAPAAIQEVCATLHRSCDTDDMEGKMASCSLHAKNCFAGDVS